MDRDLTLGLLLSMTVAWTEVRGSAVNVVGYYCLWLWHGVRIGSHAQTFIPLRATSLLFTLTCNHVMGGVCFKPFGLATHTHKWHSSAQIVSPLATSTPTMQKKKKQQKIDKIQSSHRTRRRSPLLTATHNAKVEAMPRPMSCNRWSGRGFALRFCSAKARAMIHRVNAG